MRVVVLAIGMHLVLSAFVLNVARLCIVPLYPLNRVAFFIALAYK